MDRVHSAKFMGLGIDLLSSDLVYLVFKTRTFCNYTYNNTFILFYFIEYISIIYPSVKNEFI